MSPDFGPMRTTHFLSNKDIQTAYNASGTGAPFVLVHGFTGSKLDFTDELDTFADLRHTIAYDQRGHGESSNRGPYNLDTLATDLINLLDRLDLDTCDLLGHSLGGMVALRAALAHPQRFRSLVLMDTTPEPVKLFPYLVRRKMNRLVEKQGCEALFDSMRGLPPTPAAARGIDRLGSAEHWQRIYTKLSQMDPDAFKDLGADLGRGPAITDRLSEIGCPTTVIVGEDDTPFLSAAEILANGIQGARLVKIPHAGHSPQYENTEAWRVVLRTHLESPL